jgi:hypothetical protein
MTIFHVRASNPTSAPIRTRRTPQRDATLESRASGSVRSSGNYRVAPEALEYNSKIAKTRDFHRADEESATIGKLGDRRGWDRVVGLDCRPAGPDAGKFSCNRSTVRLL